MREFVCENWLLWVLLITGVALLAAAKSGGQYD